MDNLKGFSGAVTTIFILAAIVGMAYMLRPETREPASALPEKVVTEPQVPAAAAAPPQPPVSKDPGEIKPWLDYDPTQMPLDQVLVGVWMDSPTMAAGWSNHYHFNPDGTFKFEYTNYDEEKRVIDYSGTWKVDGSTLILAITRRTVVVGGELGPASPSATSEHAIINGQRKEQAVEPAGSQKQALQVKVDYQYPHPIMISLGGVDYWKFSDDPESDFD